MAIAQQPNPGVPGNPTPTPGVPDTNAPAPAPAIPEPTTPGVDPNALQPVAPAPDTTVAPDASAPKPKPKKATAPAVPTLRGTVGSIDKNAMTITVHGKSKDETLNITSKTRIFADGKPAILADAKEGENVVAEYHSNKEKGKDALTLRFGGAGSGAGAAKIESTDNKPAPKKAPAKKATTKKKKKASTPKTETPLPPGGTENPVTPLPGTPEPAQPNPVPGNPAPAPGTPTTNP